MLTRRLVIPALPALVAAAPTIAAADPDAGAEVKAAAEVAPAPAPAVAALDAAPALPERDVGVAATAAPTPWYDAIQINAFASIGYTFNTNRPSDDTNHVRVFDTEDGTINVDIVELVLQKEPTGPGQAGFRFDLTAGSSIPAAAASSGLFEGQDFDLQQAYVSYVADLGTGLRLDVGKFVTHMGYELIEGYDGYNDHYSRSILFGYAIPFTHTGIKLGYALTDSVSAMVMVANGWDNVKDNNGGKTVGAQLGGTFGPVSAFLNYVGGPEQDGDGGPFRHVVDVVATVEAAPGVMVGLNADLGYEGDSAPDGGAATWMGAALYGRWDATSRVALALRGELFEDRDGVRTGLPQTVVEATLSPSVKLGDNVVLRGDVRLDRSSEPAFMTAEGTSRNQLTIALNALGVL